MKLTELKGAFMALFLCLAFMPGCATLSDAISKNQFVVSTATRQAVVRYIAKGTDIEAERQRALHVYERVQRVTNALDGNPSATYDGVLDTLIASVEWGGLDFTDKMLIKDVINLVRQELRTEALAGDVLNDADLIHIRGVLATAAETALAYLEQ